MAIFPTDITDKSDETQQVAERKRTYAIGIPKQIQYNFLAFITIIVNKLWLFSQVTLLMSLPRTLFNSRECLKAKKPSPILSKTESGTACHKLLKP